MTKRTKKEKQATPVVAPIANEEVKKDDAKKYEFKKVFVISSLIEKGYFPICQKNGEQNAILYWLTKEEAEAFLKSFVKSPAQIGTPFFKVEEVEMLVEIE